MDENLHNIEQLFKQELDDNRELPSSKVWQGIDNMLDKDSVIKISKKYNFLKKGALVLLLLLLCISIYEIQKISTNNMKKENYSAVPGKKNNNTENGNNNVKDQVQKDNDPINDAGNTAKNNLAVTENTAAKETTTGNSGYNKIGAVQKKITSATAGIFKMKVTSAKMDQLAAGTGEAPGPDHNTPGELNLTGHPDPGNAGINKAHINSFTANINKDISATKNNKIPKKPASSRHLPFSVSLLFSPDFAWYRLQEDQPSNQQNVNESDIEQSEKHGFSSTIGIIAGVSINKHWSVQAGISYSNTKITVEPKTLYALPDDLGNVKYRINTSSGYGYLSPSFSSNPSVGDSIYTFASLHTLKYISIPVIVAYDITKGKFTFGPLVGFSTNFLIKGNIETVVSQGSHIESQTVDNLQGLRKVYLSGIAGIGINYKLTNKLSLVFNPVYRFAINSINQQVPFKSYPNSVSLSTGIKINM